MDALAVCSPGDRWGGVGMPGGVPAAGAYPVLFFLFFLSFFTLVEHCVEQKTPLQAILRFLNLHEFT